MIKFKTSYGKKEKVSVAFLDEDGNQAIGLTKQSHKAECDINNIIKRIDRDGLVTHVNNAVAQYGDFSGEIDYQKSIALVEEANTSFLELPSKIRKEFNNDAGEFSEFATNPNNHKKLVEMGLAKEKIPPKPPKDEPPKKEDEE